MPILPVTDPQQAIIAWGGYDEIHSIGVPKDEPTQIVMTYHAQETVDLSYSITIWPDQKFKHMYKVGKFDCTDSKIIF